MSLSPSALALSAMAKQMRHLFLDPEILARYAVVCARNAKCQPAEPPRDALAVAGEVHRVRLESHQLLVWPVLGAGSLIRAVLRWLLSCSTRPPAYST